MSGFFILGWFWGITCVSVLREVVGQKVRPTMAGKFNISLRSVIFEKLDLCLV